MASMINTVCAQARVTGARAPNRRGNSLISPRGCLGNAGSPVSRLDTRLVGARRDHVASLHRLSWRRAGRRRRNCRGFVDYPTLRDDHEVSARIDVADGIASDERQVPPARPTSTTPSLSGQGLRAGGAQQFGIGHRCLSQNLGGSKPFDRLRQVTWLTAPRPWSSTEYLRCRSPTLPARSYTLAKQHDVKIATFFQVSWPPRDGASNGDLAADHASPRSDNFHLGGRVSDERAQRAAITSCGRVADQICGVHRF
jgi:hypothetical protein